VPAGQFQIGAGEQDPFAKDSEKPQHTVYLNAYWIDRMEVTSSILKMDGQMGFRCAMDAGKP
jgi:serine/threonine-protein kinase